MPKISFSAFMRYQIRAILVSGLDAHVWMDKNGARFRRSIERRFTIFY